MKNLRYYIDLIEQAGTTTLGAPTSGSSDSPGKSSFGSNLAGNIGNKVGAGVAKAQIGAAKLGGVAGAAAGGYNQQQELDAIVQKSQEIQKDQDDLSKNIQGLKKRTPPPVA